MKEWMIKNKLLIGISALFILSLGLSLVETKEPIKTSQEPVIATNPINYIYVDIKGEVYNPGVYKIHEDYRLYQLIELAGGLTEEANSLLVNLSVTLVDQQMVYIPSIHDEVDIIIDTPNNTQKLDINQASLEQLQTLPGIGPSTAQKIIEYRQEVGYFEQIEDIKNVSGIGDSIFEHIKDLITT